MLFVSTKHDDEDGENELTILVLFSPNPIITTPILCKYLDRGRDGAIWLDGPPTRFMMIAMMMMMGWGSRSK